MICEQQDVAWRVGGPQGSGVETAARLFGWACALGGLHVFGRREYYSNIIGRHSYYDIRAASRRLTSHRDDVEMLVCFEPESLVRHSLNVVPTGALVYNAADADVAFERIVFLDPRLRDDLLAYLDERGLPRTTAGLLEDALRRGAIPFAIPFDTLAARLAEQQGIPKSSADRTLNTLATAVSCAILRYDRTYLHRALERTFGKRPKVLALNVAATDLVYDYVDRELDTREFSCSMPAGDPTVEPNRLFITGAEAVALGKLAGGIAFQSYYPISPSTDESVYLEGHANVLDREGNHHSVLVVQTEDELAAVTMACGAALTGARSSTATSGPGFSLMVEALGWASINEVPIVITIWQRGGPSTGLPTRTEQGDLLCSIYAGHGEAPRIVIASGDLAESFYDAAMAFNYAERFQMPVIHLVDKHLSSTSQTMPRLDVDAVRIDRGLFARTRDTGVAYEPYARFADTESGITPRPVLGQPGGIHWVTGTEHTVYGRVTEDPVVREQQMEKRMRKLGQAARELTVGEKLTVYGPDKADLTILSWGSTKGSLLAAMQRLASAGVSARLVHVRLLWPFPSEEVCEALDGSRRLVAVEVNYSGQLTSLVSDYTHCSPEYYIVKYNGRPMSSMELFHALMRIHEGKAEERTVLRNPLE